MRSRGRGEQRCHGDRATHGRGQPGASKSVPGSLTSTCAISYACAQSASLIADATDGRFVLGLGVSHPPVE